MEQLIEFVLDFIFVIGATIGLVCAVFFSIYFVDEIYERFVHRKPKKSKKQLQEEIDSLKECCQHLTQEENSLNDRLDTLVKYLKIEQDIHKLTIEVDADYEPVVNWMSGSHGYRKTINGITAKDEEGNEFQLTPEEYEDYLALIRLIKHERET